VAVASPTKQQNVANADNTGNEQVVRAVQGAGHVHNASSRTAVAGGNHFQSNNNNNQQPNVVMPTAPRLFAGAQLPMLGTNLPFMPTHYSQIPFYYYTPPSCCGEYSSWLAGRRAGRPPHDSHCGTTQQRRLLALPQSNNSNQQG